MTQTSFATRLDRPVDDSSDHTLGPPTAGVVLVEYGSYACPHCRAANERVAELRKQFGDRLRYVFRHRPIPGNELARRAADLAERANESGRFWDAHIELMTRFPPSSAWRCWRGQVWLHSQQTVGVNH
ncbi:MAG: DsbA family protein [Opitutaceae bacterium]